METQATGTQATVLGRRSVLAAGAALPLAAAGLAGCAAGEDAAGPTATGSATPTPSGDAEPGDPSEGGALAAVEDVPAGGALVVEDGPDGKPVVLARPTGDAVVAFSAVCTHRGCTVRADGDRLLCPCHGSTYDLTGRNTGGPAPSPLPKVEVVVEDGRVRPA